MTARPVVRSLGRLVAPLAFAALITLPQLASANSLFPAPAGVRATVNLSKQQMDVVVNRGNGVKETYSWKVSTGRKGFETPPGQFRPDYLDEMHYSSKYENAPMPYSVFFNDGIAVHATSETRHLGRPASHGCVRLDKANAEVFFKAVHEIGMMRTAIIVEK
ncbi:L,D-transpeptidase [Kaistia sp. 32K]|uniref:L,D-transpeptidase n=1 Tax=Kaistia sp. 32K TaxID=2795690 RepID=UPI0019162ABA|nr:L,D-transpeptidase [Kaistia sp. 32K]BCP52897.1 L,D-transpeptidase [Kaistia sp. 32K]